MKSDEQFVSNLHESQKYVSAVASWLTAKKCVVLIKPNIVRPNFDDRSEFADSGDIEIRQQVEVKHRSVSFSSAEDYPYDTVIVDEQYKVDRIPRGQLWGYVIVNSESTHACLIMASTRSKWEVQDKYDKKDEQTRSFYFCPKRLCLFCSLDITYPIHDRT